MSSYNEDLKLAELLDYFSPGHLKEIKGEGFSAKWEELKSILRKIDRINMREFVDRKMAERLEEFIELDNEWFQEMDDEDDWVKQTDFFCENLEGHYGISVWMRNRFKLIPPFVKQGTKIPENITKLYAESRQCFIFEQYSAAIVLSRAIIEIALKKKIGFSEESRHWTAGKVLDTAFEKGILKEKTYWVANKVIKKADKILHQAKLGEQQETLNLLDHTKEFLEKLFE